MTVSILGCGWYGKAFAAELAKKGITVKGSTTSAEKIKDLSDAGISPYLINLSTDNYAINDDFFNCDVLWISIPPKARSGKGQEYMGQIKSLTGLIKPHNIQQVVLISSTGVYGDNNNIVNELDAPQPDNEAGSILLQAENILLQEKAFTTTIIRFGGLIGPGRDPGRFFAGKTGIPNGEAPVNLIHLTDCIGLSQDILTKQTFGHIFNAVAPEHPAKADFYLAAAKRSGLAEPQFIREKTNWKIVESVNIPSLLQYSYKVGLK